MIDIHLSKKEVSLYTNIIINSIKTRIDKIKAKGGVVALSGGIDSSLVAVLAKKALGDRVLALIMPEEGVSPDTDTNHAKEIVRRFNIPHREIPINGAIDWFFNIFPEKELSKREVKLALLNVKPKIRMIINYLYANLENRIVIGTTNKTELLLGYGTKYGDLAADIYPIADLYKTQVWQLAEFVGIPTEIVKKKPTAGLWKGQTDEEELGHTYAEIDKILYTLVEMEFSVKEASEYLGMPASVIEDIFKRVKLSEHKRKTPTITRLSRMCLDKDWRYPVERY